MWWAPIEARQPSSKRLNKSSYTTKHSSVNPIENGVGLPPFAPSILTAKSISMQWMRSTRLSLPTSVPGGFIVTLTGEHTGALGAIRAHARRYPDLCVVQIDAHGDLRKAYQGNPYSHASVMARVVDDGLPLVQVGIRSISSEEIDRIRSTDRIATFFAAEILDPSGPYEGKASRWVPDVVKACRGPVYLTFDCDGLDASLVPALGTPEPGGLGWYDTVNLITALANGPGILGMDISEIAPIEGFVAPQFCIARLIYRMLGRIKAGRRVH